jgi:spermidine synthase
VNVTVSAQLLWRAADVHGDSRWKTVSCARGHIRVLIVLSILLFLSGASALVYQVLWLRVLGWVFGVTVYAASSVWASFMAGLAIGSVIAGRAGDRVRRPLFWFGCAELLVGATASTSPVILEMLHRVYVIAYPSLPPHLAALTTVRFAIAFAVLIVPTAMMGATLPLAVKAVTISGGRLGERVGVLYASNTAGAIAGTLAAGLYLIPGIGIQRTFFVAAALNGVVGLSAIALSRRLPAANMSDAAATVDAASIWRAPLRLRIVIGAFAVSGFVALGLEVVWFRVLTLFLRPTVYGFAMMLATILAGTAVGSYAIAPMLDRRRSWIALLATIEAAIGVTAVLSFRPLAKLQAVSDRLTPAIAHVLPEWLGYQLAGSLLAILPTALLMGVAFPIGLRLWADPGGSDPRGTVARRIGQFYSLNVAGAILGSLVSGFLLLPAIGSYRSLALLASSAFASALALLAVSEWRRPARLVAAAAVTVVFGGAVLWSADPFDEFVAQRYAQDRIIWKEEGIESTVVVHKAPDGHLILTVNGNHQASTDESTSYVHRRIGHLPMALHPNPHTALVIGLGGGATAGAVSVHGSDVDIVELAGSVVRGARFFGSINYGVLDRPNAHLRVDDGRNFLMLTKKHYDVITADVIHPIFAGSGNLYSVEYFQLLRRVLNRGGMAVQWVAGTEAEYKIIARTFLSVFPYTTVWAGGSLLVGMTEPLRLSRGDFEMKLRDPSRAQGLHDLGTDTFERLLATFDAGPEELAAFVGPGPLLTDDRPSVEYFLSLPRDRDIDTASLKGDVRRFVVE